MLREAKEPEGGAVLRRIGAFFRGNKKLEAALYGGVILGVLLLYLAGLGKSGSSGGSEKTQTETQTARSTAAEALSEADLEQKLAAVLSCIRGAGQVEVMVTYETGTEIVTAMTTSTNSGLTEQNEGERSSSSTQTTESTEPATVSGSDGDEPIVLLERQPVVRGVIVVADGAAEVRVKLDLQRAVQAVLDIPLSKIEVFERAAAGND